MSVALSMMIVFLTASGLAPVTESTFDAIDDLVFVVTQSHAGWYY